MARSGATVRGSSNPLSLKNHIINGNFDIWQRGASFTSNFNYTADRFRWVFSGTNTNTRTITRSTSVPNNGSLYSLQYTVGTADASVGATDNEGLQYKMEGNDLRKFYGKTFTIGFWVKCSVTGVMPVVVRNGTGDTSYVATVTINAINTWEFKSVTVPAPSIGTWLFDHGAGMIIDFTVMCGSTYQSPSLNTWVSGSYVGHSTGMNINATAGATINFSQVMLNEGSFAAPFAMYGDTLAAEITACRRYYEKSYTLGNAPGSVDNTAWSGYWNAATAAASGVAGIGTRFAVEKRQAPTMGSWDGAGNGGMIGTGTPKVGLRNAGASQTQNIQPTSITATSAGFFLYHTIGSANNGIEFHWAADAEL